MAFYLRTRLPHFKYAALSLLETQTSPCFHSFNDVTSVLFPRWAATVRAFHNDGKQDGIDDATLGLHDSLKEIPHVSMKKVDDGGVIESYDAVDKGKITDSRSDAADDGGAQVLHASEIPLERIVSEASKSYDAEVDARWAIYSARCQERREIEKLKKGQSGKSSPKKVPEVLSLCNATHVREILTFPPEVLEDNRRLHQLFKVWMKEWNVRYGSKGVEMDKFKDFKFNVFRIDRENRTWGANYRLGAMADRIPGYN